VRPTQLQADPKSNCHLQMLSDWWVVYSHHQWLNSGLHQIAS